MRLTRKLRARFLSLTIDRRHDSEVMTMSTRADIIDLLDNATEEMLEKILAAAKEIVRSGKGNKVYTIEEIRAKAVPIAKKYGVKKLSLFGSYARGEADEKSDVDLIVDDGNSTKLRGFAWGGLYADIQDALGVELDILSRKSTRPRFLAKIAKDEVLIYER